MIKIPKIRLSFANKLQIVLLFSVFVIIYVWYEGKPAVIISETSYDKLTISQQKEYNKNICNGLVFYNVRTKDAKGQDTIVCAKNTVAFLKREPGQKIEISNLFHPDYFEIK